MDITSKLLLDTNGRPADGIGELAETRVNRDAGGKHFRAHAWMILAQLVDFYTAAHRLVNLVPELRSLSDAVADLADELEARHGKPA